MRVLLVLALVVAACGGGAATATPPLYAGAHQLVVPDGPSLTLLVRGDGVALVASHDGGRFEVQELSGIDGARYGLLLVGANVVLLRASSFERGDPLPSWIPAELHRQFAGES